MVRKMVKLTRWRWTVILRTRTNRAQRRKKFQRKNSKKQSRLTVAEQKQIVERPDLVEMHDVTCTFKINFRRLDFNFSNGPETSSLAQV